MDFSQWCSTGCRRQSSSETFSVTSSVKMRNKMCNQILIALLTILKLCFPLVQCNLESLCKDISSKSMELQLKTHLFCDYDSDVRPHTKNNNVTEVCITMMPKFIEFDEMTDTLNVHAWTHMNWTDPFLTWNPEDFSGISDLTVPSTDIWIPDLLVHNSGSTDEDDEPGIPKTNCMITSDGGVMCVPSVKYVSHCYTDYTNYPYDSLNCSIELVTWGYHSDEVALTSPLGGMIMNDLAPHKDWEVYNSTITLSKIVPNTITNFKNNSFTMDSYALLLVLHRQNNIIHTLYIAPAYVLTVLTLCVLWLDCHSKERTILACISFICHLLSMQHLNAFIPYNGGVVPYIIQFYEKSFVVITFALILTVLLRELQALTTPAPGWIKTGTSFILQSRVGQLLLLSILDPKASAFLESSADDNDDLMPAEKKDFTWKYLSLLIGWLAFISAFFVYVLFLALYLPVALSK